MAWRGGGTAQSYLLGYLIEKSLSLDSVFVFAVIFSAFAIPVRYQHRVLMLGIIGALIMRAAFIVAGVALLDQFHAATYLFGAMLAVAAVKMARGTDTFVVYTSNVFALLGMRALYFLLASAASQFRYLRPGLAVILSGIALKMLTSDLYTLPSWASPAFIVTVLAVVAVLSGRDTRRGRWRVRGEQQAGRLPAPGSRLAEPGLAGDDASGRAHRAGLRELTPPAPDPMADRITLALGSWGRRSLW